MSIGSLSVILSGSDAPFAKMLDDAKTKLTGFHGALSSVTTAGKVGYASGGVTGMLQSAGMAGQMSKSGVMQGAGVVMSGLGDALGSVTQFLGPIAAIGTAAIAAVNAFKNLGDNVAGFVRMANPAVADRWTRALDDASAVIGRALTPVLEIMTVIARSFADNLSVVLAPFRMLTEYFGAGKELFSALGQLFGNLLQIAILPLKAQLILLSPIITLTVKALTFFIQKLNDLLDLIRKIPGAKMILGESSGKGDSLGASMRSASYNSIDSLGKQAALNAYQATMGGGQGDPAAETAANTKDAASSLRIIAGKLVAGDSLGEQILRRIGL